MAALADDGGARWQAIARRSTGAYWRPTGRALAGGGGLASGQPAQRQLGVECGAVGQDPVIENGLSRVIVRCGGRVGIGCAGADHDEGARNLLQHVGEVLRAGQRIRTSAGSLTVTG